MGGPVAARFMVAVRGRVAFYPLQLRGRRPCLVGTLGMRCGSSLLSRVQNSILNPVWEQVRNAGAQAQGRCGFGMLSLCVWRRRCKECWLRALFLGLQSAASCPLTAGSRVPSLPRADRQQPLRIPSSRAGQQHSRSGHPSQGPYCPPLDCNRGGGHSSVQHSSRSRRPEGQHPSCLLM